VTAGAGVIAVASSPLDPIDAHIAERLLSVALGSGGDFADLYFEYRSGADFAMEEGRVRTVGRGVTVGLGVRVLRGDATGYAYTEELSDERMVDAARINPETIMPPYYRIDGLARVAPLFRGKPILTAEQIEDVVAFLATLRE